MGALVGSPSGAEHERHARGGDGRAPRGGPPRARPAAQERRERCAAKVVDEPRMGLPDSISTLRGAGGVASQRTCQRLADRMDGRTIHYGLVDSTNERAFHALHEGRAQHGDVHVAEGQTSGRGRLGTRWESAAGLGVYLTLVVRPDGIPPPGALTLAGGLAVLDVCRAHGLEAAELDWPNDVVVRGAKLAGILTESRGLAVTNPAWVLGAGVNVLQREFPPGLEAERAVTSFAREGVDVPQAVVEKALIAALRARVDAVLSNASKIFEEAFDALMQGGRPVRVEYAGEVSHGRLAALHPGRGLCLERPEGRAWVPLAHVRAVELVQGVA